MGRGCERASEAVRPGKGREPHPPVGGEFLGVVACHPVSVFRLQGTRGFSDGCLLGALGLRHGQGGFGSQGRRLGHPVNQALSFATEGVGALEWPARCFHATGPRRHGAGQTFVLEDARNVQRRQRSHGLLDAEPCCVVAVELLPGLGAAAVARSANRTTSSAKVRSLAGGPCVEAARSWCRRPASAVLRVSLLQPVVTRARRTADSTILLLLRTPCPRSPRVPQRRSLPTRRASAQESRRCREAQLCRARSEVGLPCSQYLANWHLCDER